MIHSRILTAVSSLLAQTTGITFVGQRAQLLSARIEECFQASGLATIEEFERRLNLQIPDGKLWRTLVESIVTDESSWFRYPDQFEILRDFVLPAVASNKTFSGDSELRILSAGCSRGQEPYSIVLTAREVAELGGRCRLSLLALDISDAAIAYAREAHYSEPEMRGAGHDVRGTAFTPTSTGWRLREEFRSQVEFRRHNLMSPVPGDQYDIIFCRNVVIYFEPATTRRVMTSLLRALRPGGYLFIGHAESCQGIAEELRMMQVGKALVYRRALSGGAALTKPRAAVSEEDTL